MYIRRAVEKVHLDHIIAENKSTFVALSERILVVLFGAVFCGLIARSIGIIGIYALDQSLDETFPLIELFGIATGVVIGSTSDIENYFATIFEITYYTVIGVVTCGIGVALGWILMYFFG